jgi:hypothetical protein
MTYALYRVNGNWGHAVEKLSGGYATSKEARDAAPSDVRWITDAEGCVVKRSFGSQHFELRFAVLPERGLV